METTIKIWKLPSGEPQCELATPLELLEAIVFGPNGSTLATAAKNGVQLWNVDTGEKVRSYDSMAAKNDHRVHRLEAEASSYRMVK